MLYRCCKRVFISQYIAKDYSYYKNFPRFHLPILDCLYYTIIVLRGSLRRHFNKTNTQTVFVTSRFLWQFCHLALSKCSTIQQTNVSLFNILSPPIQLLSLSTCICLSAKVFTLLHKAVTIFSCYTNVTQWKNK